MVVFIEDMLDLLYNQSQSGIPNDVDILIDAGAANRIDAIELLVLYIVRKHFPPMLP
jgi:hypothetical protein